QRNTVEMDCVDNQVTTDGGGSPPTGMVTAICSSGGPTTTTTTTTSTSTTVPPPPCAPSGVSQVKDINPGAAGSNPFISATVGGPAFFTANDGTPGAEPWKSHATAAGTVMVADINPGANSACPLFHLLPDCNPTNVNGTIFFTADDGVQGAELWKSDGTAAGTVMVADINPGANSACHGPCRPTDVNCSIFFRAAAGMHATHHCKHDATAPLPPLL